MPAWIMAVLGLVMLLASVAAKAGPVYRCMEAGKATYTDRPCAANSEPVALPALTETAAPPATGDLVEAYDATRERDLKARRERDEAWLERHRAEKERDQRMRSAMVQGRIEKGMRPQEVERVLHSPTLVENAGAAQERWIYIDGNQRRTITFKDGLVATDTTTQARKKTR